MFIAYCQNLSARYLFTWAVLIFPKHDEMHELTSHLNRGENGGTDALEK